MSHDIFALGWLKEWCSNSYEYKDFFERGKGEISSLGFMVESARNDGLQCSKLDIKKNVPLVRTVKYWGAKEKNGCGSCNNNLDVVSIFLEKEEWTGRPLKILPAFFQRAYSGYHSCQIYPQLLKSYLGYLLPLLSQSLWTSCGTSV